MRRIVSTSCAAGVLGAAVLFLPNASQAQRVSVGLTDGVHVRAPFVSVDVYPRGGVSVRAPFTAVDVGGRSIYVGPQPAINMRPVVQPPFPSPHALAAMDDNSLASRTSDHLGPVELTLKSLRLRHNLAALPPPAGGARRGLRGRYRCSPRRGEKTAATVSRRGGRPPISEDCTTPGLFRHARTSCLK